MIQINNLQKTYKSKPVLNIAHLEIPPAQSFGLVGNNGAGKTTLLRLMLDLIKSSNGEVKISGNDVSKSEEWKANTGSFIDERFLIGYLTPEEYFNFLARVRSVGAGELGIHLNNFKELFNGEIFGDNKYIRDLSKGNKKKLGVAAALLGKPQLVIMDEPFENLDPTSQIRLKRIIQNFQKEQNMTFVISSHDLNHITEICERIVILENGEIVKDLASNERTLADLNEYFSGNAMESTDEIGL